MSYRQFSVGAFIIVAIFCFSCNIQKRLYRNGYYRSNSENTRNVQSGVNDTAHKFIHSTSKPADDVLTDTVPIVTQDLIDTLASAEVQAVVRIGDQSAQEMRQDQPAPKLKEEQTVARPLFSPRATEWRYLGQALLISVVTFVLILLLFSAPNSLAWVCILGVGLTFLAVFLAIRLHHINKRKQDPKSEFSILKFLARLFLYLAILFFTTMNVVFGITEGQL